MFELSMESRKELRNEIINLLEEYDYEPTEYGVDVILTEWAKNKGNIIELFKKHQNYNGKYQIVLTGEYHRKIDTGKIRHFTWWAGERIIRNCPRPYSEEMAKQIDFWNEMYYYWKDLCGGQMATPEFAAWVNEHFVSEQNRHEVAASGQKVSRIIGKICRMTGLDKETDYHTEFTPFADACNPLRVKRYTILSCNPIDYYTMSFGNNWASCHTIDKENKRQMPNSYEGMYSSGTESYMLDESSFVVYTVDYNYVGHMWELQPKISRQMFHLGGNDYDTSTFTTLIQGRLYPQDNDTGSAELYDDMRAIVQRSLCECLEAENMWKNVKGTNACCDAVESEGTHYRDYQHYDNCNISYRMVDGKYNTEHAWVRIGHKPICPACGCEHYTDDNIECDDCVTEKHYCEYCGERVYEDDGVYAGGNWYCCSECAEEAGYVYVSDQWDWYDRDCCFWDEYDDEWHLERDCHAETVDGLMFRTEEHAEEMGYVYITGGYYAGYWAKEDDVYTCEVCGDTVYYTDFDSDMDKCKKCARLDEDGTETCDSADIKVGDRVRLIVPPAGSSRENFAGGWNYSMERYANENQFAYCISTWSYEGKVGFEVSTRKDSTFRDWIWDTRFMQKLA